MGSNFDENTKKTTDGDVLKQETSERTEKSEAKTTTMDLIATEVAEVIAQRAHYKERTRVSCEVLDLIRTLCEISKLDQYSNVLKVDTQERVPLSEYRVISILQDFIGPRSIKVSTDDDDCADIVDRSFFEMSLGKVVTPEEFAKEQHDVKTKARLVTELVECVRKDKTLSEAIKHSIHRGKVSEKVCTQFMPIKLSSLVEDGFYRYKVTFYGKKFGETYLN